MSSTSSTRVAADRIIAAEDAVRLVQAGDLVVVPIFPPRTLARALAQRLPELPGLRIRQTTALFDAGWFQGSLEGLDVNVAAETFIGPAGREAVATGRVSFLPNLFSRTAKALEERNDESQRLDVALVNVSPPDKDGWCNFGPHAWSKKALVKRSKTVLAEIDPTIRWMEGDCLVHVDELDAICEFHPRTLDRETLMAALAALPAGEREDGVRALVNGWQESGDVEIDKIGPAIPHFATMNAAQLGEFVGQRPPEAEDAAIAANLRSVLFDGATLQIGAGDPSSQMVKLGAFEGLSDLGIHSEMACPGLADLALDGIVTNERKELNPGVSIAGAWTGLTDREIAVIERNPAFQIQQLEQVLDIPVMSTLSNLVSINNAISIDLIGQINSETIYDGILRDGSGGQPEAHISGFLSRGGRAVTLLRSTAMGGTISRIVPRLSSGSTVTIPRFFADTVISEWGVASLVGKDHRERANELIGIAHPDFRDELRASARDLGLI